MHDIVELNDHKRKYLKGKHEKIMNHPSLLTFYTTISFSNGFCFETFLCSKQKREKKIDERMREIVKRNA